MGLERRSEIRRRARVTAYLCRSGRRPVRCETINISASGILVRPKGLVIPRRGEMVSLVIALEFNRVIKTYRRWARVAHRSPGGLGMRTFKDKPVYRRKTGALGG